MKWKKMIATVMAVSLAISVTPVSRAAASTENTPKEEVVYVNLGGDGSVEKINVVNIFELEQDGTIVDYGEYESLRNMNTTDEIQVSEDRITIDAKAGKLYYEGELDGKVMPWNIVIRYYIDGEELTADEIAGRSGDMKITISIDENTNANGDFFDRYALQASLTLDTETCKNITAEGATIANVGSDKQLTYTILPGEGAELVITADVTDFEMDPISINGILLNLNVEIDDEELMDQVTELVEAIEELDGGAEELQDGVDELQGSVQNDLQNGADDLSEGAKELQSGAGTLVLGGQNLESGAASLNSGANTLDDGMRSLNEGIAQVQAGLDALNEQSGSLTDGSAKMKAALEELQGVLNTVNTTAEEIQALVSTSAQIKQGIGQLETAAESLQSSISYEAYKAAMAQNGLDIDDLYDGNTAAINTINSLLGQVDSMEKVLNDMGISSDTLEPWKSQCVSLARQVVTLLEGNNASMDGTEAYLNGLYQGASDLVGGIQELKTNYTAFDTAIGELAGTLTDLMFQMTKLKDAVNMLVEEYGNLDTGLNAYTQGVAQVVAGYQEIYGGAASLVEGSGALKNGSASLYAGTSELLNGIVQFYSATGTLKDGAGQMDDGVAELVAGIALLNNGAGELKDGTSTMREETEGMDTEIRDKIDTLLEEITGGNTETVSFVSDKNTNIDAVQFVVQSSAIEVQEVDEEEIVEDEKTGIGDKFLDLFR